MDNLKCTQHILAQKVYEKLKKYSKNLATAESCTGGLIAASLTSVPGMSECYGFGVVTYANEAKEKLLSVSNETLKSYGAVSPQTAEEMANGAVEMSGADIAVSVTGIAGPGGGTAKKPVGLVYIGIALRGKGAKTYKNLFDGNRQEVRQQTVIKALELILETLDI